MAELLDQWIIWMTDLRLSRWNHIRDRAGLEPLNREQAARALYQLARAKKQQELDEIKARIAE